jgi:hypothetical protein
VPAILVICKVIFASEGTRATWSAIAPWFITVEQGSFVAKRPVNRANMPFKVTFGSEALLIVTALDSASMGSFMLVHVFSREVTN